MICKILRKEPTFVSQSGTSGVYLCRKSKDMCFSNIDIKKNKERCLELLRSTGRVGMEDMIIELEKMGYFTAPASSYYHGCNHFSGLMP